MTSVAGADELVGCAVAGVVLDSTVVVLGPLAAVGGEVVFDEVVETSDASVARTRAECGECTDAGDRSNQLAAVHR